MRDNSKLTLLALISTTSILWICFSSEGVPLQKVRNIAEPAIASVPTPADCVLIPAGEFEMGDHHGFVDPKHGGDETPVHTVRLGAFYMGIHDVTSQQYCDFLNSAVTQRMIEVRDGGVYLIGGSDLLCETRTMSPYSRIAWDGARFAVLDRKEDHPIICIRWPGAASYCNWLSAQQKLPVCYDITTWDCNFNKSGFRLPTEAEWEYAARGGQKNPYGNFPWGDDADAAKANWPESKNPFRAGPEPWTTPVGFFDGTRHRKADFGWPGTQETFQTSNGVNGYGLYDMAGNVWQFINDWYARDYYAYSPTDNPAGPERGSLMPDGKPYRGMRGGNWYNGENGHSRVSNRNPSYYRGPQDPNHPYYHLGFRVVLPVNAESRPVVKPTLTQEVGRGDVAPGGRPPRDSNRPPRPDPPRPDRNGSFVLRSPEVADGGMLPTEFTGDGSGATLPLEWSGVPEGTKSFAVIVHHIAPDMTKWYWVLYNIPANVQSLPKNVQGVGTLGTNSINDRTEYAPPHSKGPGPKTYIYTVYALSAPPQLNVPPEKVNRDVLLNAMKDRTLATAELSVVYSRPDGADGPDAKAGGRPPRGPDGEPPPPRPEGSRDGRGEDQAMRPPRPEGPRDDRGQDLAMRPPRPGDRGERPEQRGPREKVALDIATISEGKLGLVTNTAKAAPGYTLFAPKHRTMTYLINNEGQAVHQWTKSQYEPGQTVYLLENGHLLRCCFTHAQGFTRGGEGGRLEEYDWDDNLVWEFDYASDKHMLHHDIAVLPNGNILALAVERRSLDECVVAGFDPGMIRDSELYPDYVIEIEPARPKGGKIVWEWHVWDHLIQNRDSQKTNYGKVAEHPERIDVDCNGRGTPAFWNHMNSITYNAKLDQIMLSVRGCNEIWIVDHSTTAQEATGRTGGRCGKGGDLLYRWGNPAAYGRGDSRARQLFQQHDARWIPEGYPGAGNILIFNNGLDRDYSSIEEIAPPMDASGNYQLSESSAYGPFKPVWNYTAPNKTDFFSSEISGAQRLPNGNTLICAGVLGTFFEVTTKGDTVWKYVNPVVRGGILAQGEQPGVDDRGHYLNAVFRIHRYTPDYPGLTGRDLKPMGPVELPASMKGKTSLDRVNTEPERGRRPPGQNQGNEPEKRDVLRSLGYL